MIGKSPGRKEDWRFITGRGLYVEDIQLPGMSHVAFVRSPHLMPELRRYDAIKRGKFQG
jgi:aerobic carbon-monoxide dehydrogenase large subunit